MASINDVNHEARRAKLIEDHYCELAAAREWKSVENRTSVPAETAGYPGGRDLTIAEYTSLWEERLAKVLASDLTNYEWYNY